MKDIKTQLEKILNDYGKEAEKVISSAVNDTGKETANRLKTVSPNDSGKYAEGWTVKRQGKSKAGSVVGGSGVVVYNKKHYRLTHLLEHGHVIRNQYGTYSRTEAKPHIAQVEQWGIRKLISELERRL